VRLTSNSPSSRFFPIEQTFQEDLKGRCAFDHNVESIGSHGFCCNLACLKNAAKEDLKSPKCGRLRYCGACLAVHERTCEWCSKFGRRDIQIRCKKCDNFFLFTGEQQIYHEKKGWDSPKKCKECRDISRESRSVGGGDGRRNKK